jgi:hypothetical protein
MNFEFVNVYAVTRHYGGPEEGGWWYDEGEPVKSTAVRRGRALALARRWNDYLNREGGPNDGIDLGSVRCTRPLLAAIPEDHPATPFPGRKPFYE